MSAKQGLDKIIYVSLHCIHRACALHTVTLIIDLPFSLEKIPPSCFPTNPLFSNFQKRLYHRNSTSVLLANEA